MLSSFHRRFRRVAASILAIALSGPLAPSRTAWAQSPPDGEPALAHGDELAELFDAASFAQREKMMMRLWADYGHSRQDVEQLAKHADPEVAKRAEWILKRWEIGLLPDLPDAVKRRLAGAEGHPATALVALLDDGYLREAVEVVRHQANHGSEETRLQMAQVITTRYIHVAHTARENDQLEALAELLNLCAETTPLAVARVILLDQQGQSVDEANVLPACAERWPRERRDEVTVISLATLGQLDAAAEVARRVERADLLAKVLLLGGRWAELAELAHESTESSLPVAASIDQYAMWLMASNEAGAAESLAEATAKMRDAELQSGLRWRSLAVAGQFDAAVQVARASDPLAAVDLLAARQDIAAAFELLGVDPAHPEPDVDRLVDAAAMQLSSVNTAAQDDASEALETALSALRLLYSVGHQRIARPTLVRIAGLADAQGSRATAAWQATLLAWRIGMTDLIPTLMSSENDPFDSELGIRLGYYMANQSPTFFAALGAAVHEVRPNDKVSQNLADTLELLSGRLPAGWDRQADLDTLLRGLLESEPAPDTRLGLLRAQANLNRRRFGGAPVNYLTGDFFATLGRGDLAERAYERAASSSDVASMLRYADVLMTAGRASDAVDWYERAFEATRSGEESLGLTFSRPYGSPVPSASSALLGKAVALRRLGQSDASAAILATLDLAPFNPVDDMGRDYLGRLEALHEGDRQRIVAGYHLRYAAFEASGQLSSYDHFFRLAFGHAIELQQDDPAAAARWMRIGLLRTVRAEELLNTSALLTVPARWHVADALDAAKRGDAAAARASLERSLHYHPLNIAMAEEELPKIREAGLTELADEVLDRVFATGLEHIAAFPLDANATNNVAWTAAIHGRHLEEALRLANRAVFLVPDSTSYRDTLAEVLFRSGEVEQAIAVEQQCLLDEPDMWHLHEQIARFRAPK